MVPSGKGFWPDNRNPTCDEWLAWWDTLGKSDRTEVAEKVIDSADAAWVCAIQNHVGEIEYLQQANAALSKKLAEVTEEALRVKE